MNVKKIILGFMLFFVLMIHPKALTFETTSDMIVTDTSIKIDEDVNGDIYVAGNNINVNSIIEGDIIGAGNIIDVTGQVKQNVRMFGSSLSFSNLEAYDMTVAGSDILFLNVNVNKIYAVAGNIEFMGTVNNINLVGSEVIISGTINGKSSINANKVIIKNTAKINNKLNIKAINPIEYEGDILKDNIEYTKTNHIYNFSGFFVVDKHIRMIYKLLSTILVALVIVWLFDNLVNKAVKNLKENKILPILLGLVLFILMPSCIMLVMSTIIGIPIAIIISFVYIITIIITSGFTAVSLGKILFKDMNKYLQALISSFIIWCLSLISGINLLLWLVSVGYIFGSIVMLSLNKEK